MVFSEELPVPSKKTVELVQVSISLAAAKAVTMFGSSCTVRLEETWQCVGPKSKLTVSV